jgi:cytochrome c biogenesis protein CcmG/thiol:disulfide interchange protein DsbE
MLHLDKYMIAFFLILLMIMGYLMMSDRPATVSVGRLNQPVPEFSLPDLSQSKTFHANDLKGQWTLLNIWASWCAPCKLEHPVLISLAKQQYHIVGLNFKDEDPKANAFLKEGGDPYAFVIVDHEGRFGFDLGVYGVPETLLIDPKGIIRHRFAGILTEDIFNKEFLPLMHEGQ